MHMIQGIVWTCRAIWVCLYQSWFIVVSVHIVDSVCDVPCIHILPIHDMYMYLYSVSMISSCQLRHLYIQTSQFCVKLLQAMLYHVEV